MAESWSDDTRELRKKAKNAINHSTGPPAVIKSFRDANDSDMA